MNQILFLSLFFLSELTSAQNFKDTIFTQRHDTTLCHITQVTDNYIYYQYRSEKGKIESAEKSKEKVFKFCIYRDSSLGSNEEVKPIQGDSIQSQIPSYGVKMFEKGQRDARKYYKGYSEAGNGTLFIGLLSPLLGLAPAIACSSTKPKEKNLDFPSAELMKDFDYHRGYNLESRKIKRGRVWGNWGVAFGINLIVYSLVILPGSM